MTILSAVDLALLASASTIDVRTRRIPNRLVLFGFVAVLVEVASSPRGPSIPIRLAWGAAASLPMLVVILIRRDAIGMGDVKATAVIGAGLCARALAVLPVACLLAVAWVGVDCLLRRRPLSGKMTVPFMPFLAAGTIAAGFC